MGAGADRLATLVDIEAALWRELGRGVAEPAHEWHRAVLATRDGDAADARTVVLRELDAGRRELLFFSDARSPKLRQIGQHPGGTLVLWSRALSWQLRLAVQLTVATSGLSVSSRWAQLALSPAAQDYMAQQAPGSEISAPQPVRGTREHFAVVTAQVQSIDWLELHRDGHRRARFNGHAARWLTP
jgi:pyridoxamine 5'-phosphate oxidase